MTSNTVISVEHLTKQYDLGVIGTGTISRDLNRWWARVRKQPDPYTRIGQQDAFARQGESILALDDVSFQVQQGEALGIIGRNGAGKSTLLKILSRVTAPTSGVVKVKGRIGSLLEVGTGFHPELTGRENVYLNGAILGMKKTEVTRKFDEIVDFAGVEKFIDTPVKRYSSGMYVRLAFAVAAHLDPEILIVDEVLAVGDAEFQKKCLGKMGDVAGEGRTVLFVSHNMVAINSLCSKALLIENGKLKDYGDSDRVIEKYLSHNLASADTIKPGVFEFIDRDNKYAAGKTIIQKLTIYDSEDNCTDILRIGKSAKLVIDLTGISEFRNTDIGILINSSSGQRLTSTSSGMNCSQVEKPRVLNEQACLNITNLPLMPGTYSIDISATQKGIGRIDFVENAATFTVVEDDVYGSGFQLNSYFGVFYLDAEWKIVAKTRMEV